MTGTQPLHHDTVAGPRTYVGWLVGWLLVVGCRLSVVGGGGAGAGAFAFAVAVSAAVAVALFEISEY